VEIATTTELRLLRPPPGPRGTDARRDRKDECRYGCDAKDRRRHRIHIVVSLIALIAWWLLSQANNCHRGFLFFLRRGLMSHHQTDIGASTTKGPFATVLLPVSEGWRGIDFAAMAIREVMGSATGPADSMHKSPAPSV